jgi:malate dehydrogenase (quinone)
MKNFLYEVPLIRQKLFAKEVQKIIPSIQEDDITFAEGIGGLRPQVIDKKNKKLLLGEAKIDTKKGIVFNMTPSPGATSCLGNAIEDTKLICKFLDKKFKENRFKKELL